MGSGVAQMVERSLPLPEIRGLNPEIGKMLDFTVKCWKDEKKEKNRHLSIYKTEQADY